MNHIVNDKGETVIAVGAEESIGRIRIQYPKLIERINSLWWQEAKDVDAWNAIRQSGIDTNSHTAQTIFALSNYGDKRK